MIHALRLLCAVFLALAVSAMNAPPLGAEDGRVPLPNLAKAAKGDACVEPAEIMRREHMDFLEVERDRTMYLGIRDGKYSLTGCIECHATPDPEDPEVRTVEFFCDECHNYAAVRTDCWSCHNPRLVEETPGNAARLPGHSDAETLIGQLKDHLAKGAPTP